MARRLALAALVSCAALAGCGGSSGGTDTNAPQIPLAGAQTTSTQPKVVSAAQGLRLIRVGTFHSPTYLTAPPGDAHRLFVVEQEGRIWIERDRRIVKKPFLDIHKDVLAGGERGLLSMAFARDYATSHLFYVYFTGTDGDIRIQRFKTSSSNPNRADIASRRQLLRIEHSAFSNHNGGQLQIGPDGLLYAGIGDGGSEGDPNRNGQNLARPYAKILRLDPKHPDKNPTTFAYGLRNPWRFSFDDKTRDLIIGDVGQDKIEEIDFQKAGTPPGRNYGWSVFEGKSHYNNGSAPNAVPPVIQRFHSQGSCSIIGGYVVRDLGLRALYGLYVYGDLCDPVVRAAELSAGKAVGDRAIGLRVPDLSSFGEDGRGRLYAVSLSGPVYRFAG